MFLHTFTDSWSLSCSLYFETNFKKEKKLQGKYLSSWRTRKVYNLLGFSPFFVSSTVSGSWFATESEEQGVWCLCLQEGAEEEKGCFSRAVRLRVCRESKDPWSQFQVVFPVRRSHCDPLVHSPSPSCLGPKAELRAVSGSCSHRQLFFCDRGSIRAWEWGLTSEAQRLDVWREGGRQYLLSMRVLPPPFLPRKHLHFTSSKTSLSSCLGRERLG